jgi:hypothetical protein
MKRFILLLVIALSAILSLAGVTLWVRSYWVTDVIEVSPARGVQYNLVSRPGLALVSRQTLRGRTSGRFSDFSDDYDRGPGFSIRTFPGGGRSPFTPEGSPPWLQRLGFDYLSHSESRPVFGTRTFVRIVFPCWLPVVLGSLVAAVSLRVFLRDQRRRKREKMGLCITCGYDLRASQERCPECGSPIAARPSAPEA